MPDSIGRIIVPQLVPAAKFPLRTDFGHGQARKRAVIVHQFADTSGKVEQRFYTGSPAPRYTFRKNFLKHSERKALIAFWEQMRGCEGAFYYDVPQEDQTFVERQVFFEDAPLTLEQLTDAACSVGLTFVGLFDAASAPSYGITEVATRFPTGTLAAALTGQVQEIIPLIRIRVTEEAVTDIYLSDRRVTIGGILYLPRLLDIGEPGSDVLVSQSIDGATDDVRFAFGNADRVMTKLANDTELLKARAELSLYHVGSGVKLDLWAGDIVDWSCDEGPKFTVQASDIISALTLQSPVRTISRTCWRIVGDMRFGCPAAPGSTCDLGYNSPNGCLAKGGSVKLSFGAQLISPQAVTIKDNSTGTFGFGRQLVTPTSQVDESAYGKPLKEIWHNDDGIPQRGLSVKCIMIDGREESDFYEGMGIVGRGPLGAYTVARMYDSDADGKAETFLGSTLDGQPHHGFKQTDDNGSYTDSNLGLRLVLGTDPAGPGDFFSLDRLAGTPNAGEVLSGSSIFLDNYAAGVAFVVIRRTDQRGIQPSEITSHDMIAMVSRGLSGLVWGGPGSRSEVPGLTNVFWVAINTYLRSLGRETADVTTQETYFDVDSAAACAGVADSGVASLFGGGSEKQFQFKGIVDGVKPLRDRLQEILNNGLGYYTWSFGKLKLGVRVNAIPDTQFSAGNMLFGSLKLEPIKPAFEKLTVEFADEEFLFKSNTSDYTDLDYALRNGRVQNPKTSQIGLIGSSTKSQSARIAVIRTREELGGVGEDEQKKARMASWRTTILGLDTEAGRVSSLVHPDVPDGLGRFRIQSWKLNRDYSLDITAKTVTDSMYDLATGNVAVAVSSPALPTQAKIDTGTPPQPIFSGQVAPDNLMAAEVYDLHFNSTINTRTIIQGTFTFFFNDPTIIGGATQSKVVSIAFAYDFFSIIPPATTMTEAALTWVMKVTLPGMHVSRIDGYVTNVYGDSPVYSILVDLQLAGLPKQLDDELTQYMASYNASTGVFAVRHFDDAKVPTGTMDGNNPTFTLPHAPTPPACLQLFENGVEQFLGVDYTLSGATVTLIGRAAGEYPNAADGDKIRVFYRRSD
jgi:hypothetical protein